MSAHTRPTLSGGKAFPKGWLSSKTLMAAKAAAALSREDFRGCTNISGYMFYHSMCFINLRLYTYICVYIIHAICTCGLLSISVICIDRDKKHLTFFDYLVGIHQSQILNVLSGPKYIVHKGSTIITAAWWVLAVGKTDDRRQAPPPSRPSAAASPPSWEAARRS